MGWGVLVEAKRRALTRYSTLFHPAREAGFAPSIRLRLSSHSHPVKIRVPSLSSTTTLAYIGGSWIRAANGGCPCCSSAQSSQLASWVYQSAYLFALPSFAPTRATMMLSLTRCPGIGQRSAMLPSLSIRSLSTSTGVLPAHRTTGERITPARF